MGEYETRMMKVEHELEMIHADFDRLLETVDKNQAMLVSYGEKYTKFLDEMIAEKQDQKELRKMIRDKLAVGITWATLSFICLAIVHYVKMWIKL